MLLQGLIGNTSSSLYYLKYVISLLLSQKRLACFKTVSILKYNVLRLPNDNVILLQSRTLTESCIGAAYAHYFVICLLASKPAAAEITDNASTLKGWMWRC